MNISLDKNTENITQLTISEIDLISKTKLSFTLYYACHILIAVRDIDDVYYVSKNIYSNDMDSINMIEEYLSTIEPNRQKRLNREIFEKRAQRIINQIIFNPFNPYESYQRGKIKSGKY